MKVLFLSRWFPYPIDNGSKLRIYNLLRGLGQHHEVTLLSFTDQTPTNPIAPEIQSLCSDVYIVPWKEFSPDSLSARLGFFSLKPRSLIDTFSAEMAGTITKLLQSARYDLVIASQLPMAAYHSYFNGVPALLEELELGLSLEDSHHASDWKTKYRHTLTWLKLRTYLSGLLKSFRAVTVVSERERELVLRYFPAVEKIAVIPNSLNMANYKEIQRESGPNRLIFTGSFRYHVNYEAMCWFVGKVFPRVLEQMPEVELIITGDHANLVLPVCRNVTLAGHVNDVGSMIASSTIAIAPIWSGGGTRLKILEAMAIGTPVVATSKGAEGLDICSGEHFLVADDPVEFSDCVIRLLRDTELRQELAQRAGLLVREKYDWARTLPDFVSLAESIAT